ncbi:MAG: V-type ATP synthase subunit E [Emergencia sp.]
MSIEKITSKIIRDAESQAEAAMNEVKTQCDAILAQAGTEADEILKKAEKDGQADREKLISRRKAVADIDSRKIVLGEKQKLIAECFDGAVEKITAMDSGEYIAFLVDLLRKTGETEGELILNKKDAAAIGEGLVAAAAEKIPGSRITLGNETRNIQGGFLLKKGSVYVNGTIEALVSEAREELTGEVAARLFE